MSTNFVEKVREIVELLRHNPNLILYGPPGTGKTYTAKAVALYLLKIDKPFEEENLKSKLRELVENIESNKDWAKELDKYKDDNEENNKDENRGRFSIVQFHPSYNYDDFVVGIEAKTKNEQVVFEKVWRALGEMSRRALVRMVLGEEEFKNYIEKKDKRDEIYEKAKKGWEEGKIKDTSPFILIIDEINRANLPAVLGELIYALEYRGEPVNIMYGEELIIPPNLYIIGTMNTADRSAGRIDYAIRRRFTFYPMHAEINRADDYGQPLMEAVNEFITNNISPEYDPEDIKIGHTYFMGESADEIAYKFLYQVVPLLYEYIQDGLIRAEREEKEENGKKLFKGYKITLNGKEFYIRGGRLYKKADPTKPITLSEMEKLLETSADSNTKAVKEGTDSNNGEENADSKQKNPEESQQPEK